MSWETGNQKLDKKFKNINQEILDTEGFIDEKKAKILLYKFLKENPTVTVTIEGHTDSVGTEKSNQLLSERRANAVKDYLVANGISDDRLSAVGYGEARPIDDNKTRAGRTNNRRVEVKLND